MQRIVGGMLATLSLLLAAFMLLGSLESKTGYIAVALGMGLSGTGLIATSYSRDRDTD